MAAFEGGQIIVSLPTTSTGLAQYRFCTVNTNGYVAYPATLGPTIGVLQDGTTGSTHHPTVVRVAIAGISKLAMSSASTKSVGDLVAASSHGSGWAMTAAAVPAGMIVSGSSGGANRVVSVLIAGVNASTATV